MLRLLHDKPATIKRNITNALKTLQVFSYDIVRIQAAVNIEEHKITAPPISVKAYYDIEDGHLILERPVTDRSWSHIFNAIFHQLIPEESGSEISKLTLSVRPLILISTAEAHQELTDAGFPSLQQVIKDENEDLTSPQLIEFGGTIEIEDEQFDQAPYAPQVASNEVPQKADKTTRRSGDVIIRAGQSGPADSNIPNIFAPTGTTQSTVEMETPQTSLLDKPFEVIPSQGQNLPQNKKSKNKNRAKQKEQWNRRLLSYVRKKVENEEDFGKQGSISEHNLAVEAIARKAVCDYEKSRGRVAEQMPQTHPGYDIISRNPLTGEERYVEVKGINGEWNQTGVGLSKLQFSNAQDHGNDYWLYVVELISDPKHMRVYPIGNPALQVTAFMFDGSWRDAVTEEREDPSLAFIAGARVKHQTFGFGHIESMTFRGETRVMSINFDQYGKRTVTLNLQVMETIEDDYGNNAS